MAARGVALADAVVLALGEEAEAKRVYQFDYRLDVVEEMPSGRFVYVFHSAYGKPEPASRGEDLNEFTISVVILERYEGDEEVPPEEWLDDRVLWVQDNVFDPLEDPRNVPAAIEALGDIWPQKSAVHPVCDIDHLRERKLFFSVVQITFRSIS